MTNGRVLCGFWGVFLFCFWLSHLYCSCLCFVPVCLSPFRVRWCLALQHSDLGSHLLNSESLVLNTCSLLSLHDESISSHFKFKNTYSVLNFGNTKLDNTQSLFQGNLKASRDESHIRGIIIVIQSSQERVKPRVFWETGQFSHLPVMRSWVGNVNSVASVSVKCRTQ